MIGVVAESVAGETRVAATPETVGKLIGLGYAVLVESGAGQAVVVRRRGVRRGGCDSIGAKAEAWGSEIVLKVNASEHG